LSTVWSQKNKEQVLHCVRVVCGNGSV
jgi:hypothetical protein